MEFKYTISIIIATYNPEIQKLKQTIKSITAQKDIDFEIIVVDDGSINDFSREIYAFFDEISFFDYKIIMNAQNHGTVRNIYEALKYVNGRFVKTISPGDLLYCEDVLKNWYEHMLFMDADVSFGDVVHYYNKDNKIKVFSTKGNPVCRRLYQDVNKMNRRSSFVDYLLANDTVNGASLMMKTTVMSKYLNMIVDKVKYAEDYMVRIMVFDFVRITYFSSKVIWYEYGSGISTSKNDIWAKRLLEDFEACNYIISKLESKNDKIAERYKLFLQHKFKKDIYRKILKVLYFPDVIFWRGMMKISRSKYPKNLEYEWIMNILDVEEIESK